MRVGRGDGTSDILVLFQVSVQISGASADKDLSVSLYQEFIKRFRKIIDNPESGSKELAVAVKGYGYFAKVLRPTYSSRDFL